MTRNREPTLRDRTAPPKAVTDCASSRDHQIKEVGVAPGIGVEHLAIGSANQLEELNSAWRSRWHLHSVTPPPHRFSRQTQPFFRWAVWRRGGLLSPADCRDTTATDRTYYGQVESHALTA